MKLTFNGRDLIMVKAPRNGECVGCVYQNEDSKCCPTDTNLLKLCYDESLMQDDDITFKDDKIFIDDTPEALAQYAANTLEGTWG